MSYKTIISIFFIMILSMSCSLKGPPQSITVLVKFEECEDDTCDWSVQYQYDDRRKEVFEQNESEFRFHEFDPKINPDPIPQPEAIGYTKSDRKKPVPKIPDSKDPDKVRVLSGPSFPLAPDSSIRKYNEAGKLLRDDWDTDADQVMDMYYLYHYNNDNNLIKIQLFALPENRQIHPQDIYIEYDRDGSLIKEGSSHICVGTTNILC